MKKCKKCKETKPLTEFYSRGDRVASICRVCDMQKKMEFKAKYPEKVKARDRRYALKKLYGITIEEYNRLLKEQDECCAICGKHQLDFEKHLVVDHDHNTGEVRGLLCNNCNLMIGNSKDDPDILINGSKYLLGEAIVQSVSHKR